MCYIFPKCIEIRSAKNLWGIISLRWVLQRIWIKINIFFAFCLWQLFCNEKNVWKTRVFMMIVKEAKIWLKCFLQFLHDLICDFFALYLSQYRLNKLFLHNLLLWFSFYVQISYSNSSSPFFSLVLFYRFPSNFHFLQSLYLQYNCI